MDRKRLDSWCERGIFALVLALLIFAPLATGATRDKDFLVVQWVMVAVALLWAARFRLNPELKLHWPPVCWGVILFTLYAFIRYLTADQEFTARQELVRILCYAILFLAVAQNLQREMYTRIIALTAILLGMSIALYGIYQFLTESDRVWHFTKPAIYNKRGSGTYICPNHFAGYLEMVIPLALAYTLTGRMNTLTKVFLSYSAIVMVLGVVVSVSRGGWVACGLSILVFLCWLMTRREYRIPAMILVSMLVLIGLGMAIKELPSLNRHKRLTMASLQDVRFLIWESAYVMWKDHAWFGVGPNHFDLRYRQYRLSHRDAQTRPTRVHNDYLNTLVDWGILGAILVLATWVVFFHMILKRWAWLQLKQNDPHTLPGWRTSFVLGGVVGLFALLLHSFFDFNMHVPANAMFCVTLMALVTGQIRVAQEKDCFVPSPRLRLLVPVVLVGVACLLTVWNIRRTVEIHWIVKGNALPRGSGEQIEAYKKVLAMEPGKPRMAYRIGEIYRLRSWEGESGYEDQAREAMTWYEKGQAINAFNPYNALRLGMCLDWLGRTEESGPYYDEAHRLDPNGYYVTALIGWHWIQKREWAKAKPWLERSIELHSDNNFLAWFYLQRVKEELGEK